MKSEKGITLTSLVIYVIVATIVIGIIAMFSSFFFSNMNLIADQDYYATEFNKFNMFFIEDVKSNRIAIIDENNTRITLEDGTVYRYSNEDKSIYRNDVKITEKVEVAEFTSNEIKVENTIKQTITVNMTIGKNKKYSKEIEYTLRYW